MHEPLRISKTADERFAESEAIMAKAAPQHYNGRRKSGHFVTSIGTDSHDSHDSHGVGDQKRPQTLPLQRPVDPPTPFPVDDLGPILSGAAKDIADSVQAPMGICCNSILAAAALAVQGHGDVEIDGRRFPTSEFFVSVGSSGERKSAVDKAALRPHREHQEALRVEFKSEIKNFLRLEAAYKSACLDATHGKDKKDFRSKRTALESLADDEPVRPLDPLLLCSEPTYEGLTKMLATGQPSIGLFSDEGGRFLGGHAMNSDNLLKTAAGLSGLWDGQPISRVRASEGAMLLVGRRVSMHLMAQPAISRMMLSNNVLIEQGMLSRCLVSWPQSTVGERSYQRIDISQSAGLNAYNERMAAILSKDPPLLGDALNELLPRVLPLEDKAKELWVSFHDFIEPQLREGGSLERVKGFGNKTPEHAARLAGILALVEDIDCTFINEQSMSSGIKLAMYYLNEALRLFDSGTIDQKIISAEKLLVWLRSRQKDGVFNPLVSLVEVYKNGPGSVRTADPARELMAVLEQHGYAIPTSELVEFDGVLRKESWRIVGDV